MNSQPGPGSIRSRFAWAITALILALLPYLGTWAVLESPLMALDEPPASIATPNPSNAPWPYVTQTQEIMVYFSPRLAAVTDRLAWMVYASAVVWAVVAPLYFRAAGEGRFAMPLSRRGGLIVTSLLFGVLLAWPWLFALFNVVWR